MEHREQAEELEQQAERLEQESERVEEHIDATRRDWESKQHDAKVPGAVPDPEDDEDKPQAAQSERGESAQDAGQ